MWSLSKSNSTQHKSIVNYRVQKLYFIHPTVFQLVLPESSLQEYSYCISNVTENITEPVV